MPVFVNTATDAASSILQQDYLPGIQAQLNSNTVLSDRLQRVPKHRFRGNQVELSAHTARGVTQTVGNMGAGDSLPPRSSQGFTTVTFDVRELAHRIGVAAIGLARTEDAPEGAFVDLLEVEMMGAKDDYMQERNRQWFHNADGDLATFSSAGTATTELIVDSTRFLREGMPIYLEDTAGNDVDANTANTISSINSGTSISLSAGATVATTTQIFHRNSNTSLRDTDQFGLAAIVATSNPAIANFGGVDRTSNRFWQGNVLDNGGTNRALSSALLKQGLNLSWRRGGKPSLGITNDAIMLEYGAILAADKRYPGDFVMLDGGWEALSFAGTPIVADKDATANSLYWIKEDDLMIAEKGSVQFEDRDGSVFFRVSDRHQFEVLLYGFSNLVAKRCNTSTRITDIQEDFQTHNL